MKYFIVSLIIILFTFHIQSCSRKTKRGTAQIQFETTVHSFGEIELNGNGSYSFRYTNKGKVPLIIYNVKPSCGCTLPEWTREPIAPGESEMISIEYDTSIRGSFRKTILVYYNGNESPYILTIHGIVE